MRSIITSMIIVVFCHTLLFGAAGEQKKDEKKIVKIHRNRQQGSPPGGPDWVRDPLEVIELDESTARELLDAYLNASGQDALVKEQACYAVLNNIKNDKLLTLFKQELVCVQQERLKRLLAEQEARSNELARLMSSQILPKEGKDGKDEFTGTLLNTLNKLREHLSAPRSKGCCGMCGGR